MDISLLDLGIGLSNADSGQSSESWHQYAFAVLQSSPAGSSEVRLPLWFSSHSLVHCGSSFLNLFRSLHTAKGRLWISSGVAGEDARERDEREDEGECEDEDGTSMSIGSGPYILCRSSTCH